MCVCSYAKKINLYVKITRMFDNIVKSRIYSTEMFSQNRFIIFNLKINLPSGQHLKSTQRPRVRGII